MNGQNSNWRIISHNLQRIAALQAPNIKLELHTTFGIYNCFNVAELIEWTKQQQCFADLPFVNIVYQPTYQDVRLLPDYAKQEIRAEIEQALAGYENQRNYSSWQGALNYMDNAATDMVIYNFKDWPEDSWQQFWHDADQLDQLKSRKMQDYLPRLARLRP